MSALPQDIVANPILSRWVAIDPDGRVVVRTGKVELGQGAVTAIAAIAAAELGIAIAELDIVAGDTRDAPDEGMTAGSLSIENGGAAMRWAAAAARELFAAAAATRLGCAAADIRIEDGRFAAADRNERFSYGDLADDVNLDRSIVDLAPPRMGERTPRAKFPRLDLPAKMSGAAFIQDLDRESLLHGRVLRPPRPGARIQHIDTDAISALAGVTTVVVDGDFAGIVARRDEDADRASEQAAKFILWDGPALPALDDENGWMEHAAPAAVATVVDDGEDSGGATLRHEAVYSRPYIAHASIGPSTALAEWTGDRLTVWSHTQGVYPLRAALASALDCAADRIDVIHAMGAGCYGHNGADDVALDAALLARKARAPVLCRWSRADEMAWSPFGAPMRMRLAAGLDAAGRIVDWSHDVWSPPHVARPGVGDGVNLLAAAHLERPKSPARAAIFPGPSGAGDRNAVPLYDVGRRRVTHHLLPQGPLRTSALRSLGAHGNVFAIESFMDELADHAGVDPIEFRLRHIRDERARAVVTAAALSAGWKTGERGGEGVGRGVGFARYKNFGGYCAVVARVEVTDKVALTQVHAAVDCGQIIHRDGLLNQIEGGIVQAASWTLKERVRWNAEGVTSRSWANYPILNFSECPEISVELIEPDGAPSLGGGECATGPTAAAIGNALAHALGLRVRHMPLDAERIRRTIEMQDTGVQK